MLASLEIRGFRTFSHLRIEGLARVNLFVGANNSGKTSVLEACEILMAGGRPWVLLRSPTRRGDGFPPEQRSSPQSVDVRHLFHGRRLEVGSRFEIEGEGGPRRRVQCELVPSSANAEQLSDALSLPGVEVGGAAFDGESPLAPSEPPLAIAISGDRESRRILGLTSDGRLPISLAARRPGGDEADRTAVNFISTSDPDYRLAALWDQVLLTPNEERVVEALQIIDPSIERVASLTRASGRGAPSPIVLRLRGSDARVPIGSMGDGIKRLLVLSVNLVTSSGGCVLMDEIDTGLHYSVMAKMWKLLVETARRLDVQVLASTHSLDCLQALAHVCREDPQLSGEVAVHRIENDRADSTRYSADELAVVVGHELEIR